MRRWCRQYLVVLLLTNGASSGCGTVHNLVAPPVAKADGLPAIGPVSCLPFGGASRSLVAGGLGTSLGVSELIDGESILIRGDGVNEGFAKLGNGLWASGFGLFFIVDTPVSLIGDIITYPIAVARQNQLPWATSWGEQSDGTRHFPMFSSPAGQVNDEQPTSYSRLWRSTSGNEQKKQE